MARSAARSLRCSTRRTPASTAPISSRSLPTTASWTARRRPVTLNVTDSNTPPTIDSTPITQATVGANYTYQVTASDADGDTLGYFLSTAPAGMSITAAGLIEWLVPAAGSFDVVVDVTDGNGGLAQQAYTIVVSDNSPPEFTQIPLLNAPLGETYRGFGIATDPDGDAITFVLTTGPCGQFDQRSG